MNFVKFFDFSTPAGIFRYGVTSDRAPYHVEQVENSMQLYFVADVENINCISDNNLGVRNVFEHWHASQIADLLNAPAEKPIEKS